MGVWRNVYGLPQESLRGLSIMPDTLAAGPFGAPGGSDTHYGDAQTLRCDECGYSALAYPYATIDPLDWECRRCGQHSKNGRYCVACFGRDCRCAAA